MTMSDIQCPCGSGQKVTRCCAKTTLFPRSPPPGLEPVLTEAYLHAQRVLGAPDAFQRMSDCMTLLREMFREGGPLSSLRWPWEELVPPVERHIFRVMAEVEGIDERHERLFERCAPDLIDPKRLERLNEGLRRELMSPERTADEKCALAVAVMELLSAPRHPPYSKEGLSVVSWLLMAQVDEWVGRRQLVQAVVDETLGNTRGAGLHAGFIGGVVTEPELLEAALARAAQVDPELMELLGQFEVAILGGILAGRTPEVLHGEEWLWMTAVLREPLDPDRAPTADGLALLRVLDARVQQVVLSRVEAAGRDRSSPPEAEQWFSWAYKVLVARPVAFFGAFARAREAVLLERFAGEAEWVHALRRRERWRPEELEPYRLRLEAVGAPEAARCVRRLQAYLRGETPAGGRGFMT
ncbi:SEC-C motif domain protein [Cystobacter fuscus]|uniref:SEC-C motif domain protein n=1 Tax=Cystobacter fuscus TaxID=43 RepID=A0A250IX50_9BACT|nr:SEC-C domain-containing protein [Cystobacter fuscus]ATB35476.1 SEC-C motif domain protein [Cystobacter fuscus]